MDKKEKEGKLLLRHLVGKVMDGLIKKGVKNIDSNYFQFVIYNVLKKSPELSKKIPAGWFIHGPYISWLDDVLVDDFNMDPKFHQLKGKEPYNREFSETEFVKYDMSPPNHEHLKEASNMFEDLNRRLKNNEVGEEEMKQLIKIWEESTEAAIKEGDSMSIRYLHLHVKKEYWLQVKNGEKTEEFREITDNWDKQLKKEYDVIRYYLGYPKGQDSSKILEFDWTKPYKKKITHELFGEDVLVWVIPLNPKSGKSD